MTVWNMAGIALPCGEPEGVSSPLLAFAALVALSPIISRPAPPTTPASTAPTVVRQTLPGGLRLIVAERPDAEVVALDFRVQVGVGDETPETSGMAHAVEHLVFKGTADRLPGQLDAAVETLGGELSARTTRDFTQFQVAVPNESWKGALQELGGMVFKPAFRQEDWAAERAVIRAERAIHRTEAGRAGLAALLERLWSADEPYGWPLMGTDGALERYTADDLHVFYQTHYVPSKMILAVAGPVKAKEVAEAVEALIPRDASLPADPATLRRAVPRWGELAGRRAELPTGFDGAAQSTLQIAWPTTPVGDARAGALLATLAEILAGGGDRGRLSTALMGEKPLALSLSADALPQRGGGVFLLEATALPKNLPALEKSLLAELIRIREDGVTPAEIDAARAAVRARVRADESRVTTLASRLALYEALDASEALSGFDAQLDRLTPADLTAALALFARDDSRAVALIAPKPAAPEEKP